MSSRLFVTVFAVVGIFCAGTANGADVQALVQSCAACHGENGLPADHGVETMPGLSVRKVWRALGRVGLYVPGGETPLFSTLLMGFTGQLLVWNQDSYWAIAVGAEQAARTCIVPILKRKTATIAASDNTSAQGLTLASSGMSKPKP